VPPVALTLASAPARLSACAATACSAAPAAAPVEPRPVPEAVPTAVALPVAALPVAVPAPAEPPAVTPRPRLRLVTSATLTSATLVEEPAAHGRGGPASCRCRECVMARHPASLPRLSVVR
jgi:hypothetical protein